MDISGSHSVKDPGAEICMQVQLPQVPEPCAADRAMSYPLAKAAGGHYSILGRWRICKISPSILFIYFL